MTKLIWRSLTIDQKVERIAELHTEGDSARVLAAKLSESFTTPINRHMVTSIYRNRPEMREKFPLGGGRVPKTGETKPNTSKAKTVKPVDAPTVPRRGWESHLEDSVILERKSYDESALKVGLMDLTSSMCHFAINDGGPFLFCGHKSAPGKEYCQHHYDRMFYKFVPTPRVKQPPERISKLLEKQY